MPIAPPPSTLNDSGGTDWHAAYTHLMQTIMANNPSARCYDSMGKLIRPLENYHPQIRAWWRSFAAR